MKKSYFVALLVGTIGALVFSIGMCMVLLPEWKLFQQGLMVGVGGLCILLLTIFIYRKMEKKAPIKLTNKRIMSILLLVVGICAFAVGMCMTMVYAQFMFGSIIGILGIITMICVIPLYKGLT